MDQIAGSSSDPRSQMQVTIRKCQLQGHQLLLIFDSKIGSWFEGAGDVVGYHMISWCHGGIANHEKSSNIMGLYSIIYIYTHILNTHELGLVASKIKLLQGPILLDGHWRCRVATWDLPKTGWWFFATHLKNMKINGKDDPICCGK